MKSILKKVVSGIGYEIRRKQEIEEMRGIEILTLLRSENEADADARDFIKFVLDNVKESKSQVFQDLFALFCLKQKRNGFFVEFGASDGSFLSNSVLLERNYCWRGIVAEPSRVWHAELRKNRCCAIDLRCVWTETGKTLSFSEVAEPVYSTITSFKGSDGHKRTNSKNYAVETISLNDLLDEHNAPREIDYLSIDTEGSELEILKAFDFSKRTFQVITVEHNYNRKRTELFSLLTSKGYRRRFENISRWDDWYVR